MITAHTEIRCITAPGTGQGHRWQVVLGGQTSNFAGSTSYAPPVLTSYQSFNLKNTAVDAIPAATPGGELIIILGECLLCILYFSARYDASCCIYEPLC